MGRDFVIHLYVWFSWFILAICLALCPISFFTFAKKEEPTILALSWAAMIISALGVVVTVEIRKAQHEDGGDS